MARNTQDSLREQSRQMDCLYNETDRLYNGFARSCGLSECAYWVMYEIDDFAHFVDGAGVARQMRECHGG